MQAAIRRSENERERNNKIERVDICLPAREQSVGGLKKKVSDKVNDKKREKYQRVNSKILKILRERRIENRRAETDRKK